MPACSFLFKSQKLGKRQTIIHKKWLLRFEEKKKAFSVFLLPAHGGLIRHTETHVQCAPLKDKKGEGKGLMLVPHGLGRRDKWPGGRGGHHCGCTG